MFASLKRAFLGSPTHHPEVALKGAVGSRPLVGENWSPGGRLGRLPCPSLLCLPPLSLWFLICLYHSSASCGIIPWAWAILLTADPPPPGCLPTLDPTLLAPQDRLSPTLPSAHFLFGHLFLLTFPICTPALVQKSRLWSLGNAACSSAFVVGAHLFSAGVEKGTGQAP